MNKNESKSETISWTIKIKQEKQPEQEPQNTEAGESHTYNGKKNVRRKTRIQEWGKVK